MDALKDIPASAFPVEVWRALTLILLSLLCLIGLKCFLWLKATFMNMVEKTQRHDDEILEIQQHVGLIVKPRRYGKSKRSN
jgi:hypothetical protein